MAVTMAANGSERKMVLATPFLKISFCFYFQRFNLVRTIGLEPTTSTMSR